MNIRTKLTLQFTIIIALILIIFSISLYYFQADYRKREYLERIETRARMVARLLGNRKNVDKRIFAIIDRSASDFSLLDEYIEIYDRNEDLVYKRGLGDPLNFTPLIRESLAKNKKYSFKNNLNDALVLLHFTNKKPYYIYVSAFDKYGLQKLNNLLNILIIGLGGSIILSLFFGYYLSFRALSPINTIIEEVNNITASNLSKRINEGNNIDELAILAKTFNHMLQRLELAFEMQKNFVNNASHEFRTPLTLILGEIELALKKDVSIQEYKIILNDIYSDIKSLDHLSNDLLDLAYVSFDKSNIFLDEVRVDEALLQVSEEIPRRKKECKIDLRFGYMPENSDRLIIVGNEFFLKTVFSNLINNGCKYSENHSVQIFFTVNDHSIVITFTDQGIGIPEGETDKIFQPFYRASNQKSRQGHGLGLALVENIIKLHKGNISVSSVLNQGTTFTVEFFTN